MVDDQLLLVTRLCEQFFCTENTFQTVSVIRKLAIIKKQEYLIRAHCVRHVKYVMQRMSRDRLLQSITADSLLAPKKVSKTISSEAVQMKNYRLMLCPNDNSNPVLSKTMLAL